MSRTASGVIQQFPNNTCSVCVSVYTSYQTISLFIYLSDNNFSNRRYITYGKEEEAVRCIQAVHGFILDGKPLK